MAELGTRLKEARLQKGYSLDDLQEITKIQKRYLIGIEEGNYSSMPGSFYVRAFIKQYAEAVGLNANDILEQYQNEIPATQATEVAQSFTKSHNRRNLANKTNTNKMMESMPKLIVALFVIVILVVVITLISKKMNETSPIVDDDDLQVEIEKQPVTTDSEEEDKTKNEASKEDSEESEEDVVENEPKQVLSAATPLSDGESFEYTLTGVEEMKVRVEVVNDSSWVGIRDNTGVELLGDNAKAYNVGEKVEFDASDKEYVRIRLGRALNVKVYINDEEVPMDDEKVTQNLIIKKEAAAQ